MCAGQTGVVPMSCILGPNIALNAGAEVWVKSGEFYTLRTSSGFLHSDPRGFVNPLGPQDLQFTVLIFLKGVLLGDLSGSTEESP